MNEIEVRAFLLGLLGLVLSFYSLTNGQTEWIIGAKGLFAPPSQGRVRPYVVPDGRKIIVGLGVLHSIVSGALSLCLIIGVLTSKKVLLLPPLVYMISELVKDISTSIVASSFIIVGFGHPVALVYMLFNSSMLAFNAYLWYGAIQLYEHYAMKEEIPECERIKELTETSWQEYSEQRDSERSESLEVNFGLMGSKKSIMEEFEEFKRKEEEKEEYNIQAIRKGFIESLSDIDSELIN